MEFLSWTVFFRVYYVLNSSPSYALVKILTSVSSSRQQKTVLIDFHLLLLFFFIFVSLCLSAIALWPSHSLSYFHIIITNSLHVNVQAEPLKPFLFIFVSLQNLLLFCLINFWFVLRQHLSLEFFKPSLHLLILNLSAFKLPFHGLSFFDQNSVHLFWALRQLLQSRFRLFRWPFSIFFF